MTQATPAAGPLPCPKPNKLHFLATLAGLVRLCLAELQFGWATHGSWRHIVPRECDMLLAGVSRCRHSHVCLPDQYAALLSTVPRQSGACQPLLAGCSGCKHSNVYLPDQCAALLSTVPRQSEAGQQHRHCRMCRHPENLKSCHTITNWCVACR